MNKIRVYLLLAVIMTFGVFDVRATAVTTNAATSVTTQSAVLNGNLGVCSSASCTVWFEYGIGGYSFKTANQTLTVPGAYSISVSGSQIFANTNYIFRSKADDGMTSVVGLPLSFTTTQVSTITGYNFDAHTQTLVNEKLNNSQMVVTIPLAYTDRVGALFWGLLFSFIFILMFMRQGDITIPTEIGMIVGAMLWSFMPPEWVQIAYSLMIVSFAGFVFSVIKKGR